MLMCVCTCLCVCAWPSGCVRPRLKDRNKDDRTEADEEGAGGSLGSLPVPTVTALAARDTVEKGYDVSTPAGRSRPLSLQGLGSWRPG